MLWSVWSVLLVAALADLPQVEVDTLKGEHHSGRLNQLNETSLRLGEGDFRRAEGRGE